MNAKPLASLTQAVTILLGLCALDVVIATVLRGMLYVKVSKLGQDGGWQFPSRDLMDVVEVSQIAVPVVSYIFFFIWLYRLNSNLRALTEAPMRFTPGWSVGWFFVPFMNFFRPYQVMLELWRVCHAKLTATSALLGGWWVLWLTSFAVARVAAQSMIKAESTEQSNRALLLVMAADLLECLKFILMLLVVQRLWAAYCQNIDDENQALSEPGA